MKYKDLTVGSLQQSMGIQGWYRAIKYNAMGQMNLDTGWRKNKYTTQGLNNIGGSSQSAPEPSYRCGLGTSNAATTSGMTELVAPLGTLPSRRVAYEYSYRGAWQNLSSPYDRWAQQGYRFGPGIATGLIQEMGVFPDTAVDTMTTRHVVSPAVNKLADETLDVYWKLGVWPDLVDKTGVVSIAGEDYNYLLRPWNLIQNDWSTLRTILQPSRADTGFPYNYVYSGNIGSLIGIPTGTNTGANATSNYVPYVPGSFTKEHELFYGLDVINIAGGIRSITLGSFHYGVQIQFDRVSDGEKILKDNTKVITFNFQTTWAERP